MGRTKTLGGRCLGCGYSVFSVGCQRVLVSSASSHNRSNLLFTLVTQGSSKSQWISPVLFPLHLFRRTYPLCILLAFCPFAGILNSKKKSDPQSYWEHQFIFKELLFSSSAQDYTIYPAIQHFIKLFGHPLLVFNCYLICSAFL